MSTAADTPLPPDSWPGAGGRRSVAPQVAPWPGTTAKTSGPGESWPGARPAAAPAAAPRDLDEGALRNLRRRRPKHLVSPKAKTLWRLTGLLMWIVPLVAVTVWVVLDDAHRSWQGIAFVVALALALFFVVAVPEWRYRVHRWEVTDEAVYTQTGWLVQERRIAPISRIRTVDSEFGPMEQMFGLGTLTVTTDSAKGVIKVSGIERGTVEKLVSDLTRR